MSIFYGLARWYPLAQTSTEDTRPKTNCSTFVSSSGSCESGKNYGVSIRYVCIPAGQKSHL